MKAQKISVSAGHPKAGDYESSAREVILSAANTYRALLVFQGAFPTSSEELELVKRAWKRVNVDREMNPMGLTPDIVRIVSFFSLFSVLFWPTISRSRPTALRPVARQNPRQLLSLRLYMALTAGKLRRQLPKTIERRKN